MYKLTKRLFDFVFALVGLILFAPLMLLIIILIRLESPGPVFYRQARVGQNARQFPVLKFRTMMVAADDALHKSYVEKLIRGDFGPEKGAASRKLKNDPRITRIGLFVRRYSLDELPQLYNVLLGDMSFIGPRAAMPFEVEHYDERQRERLKAKPGLTGLWQVHGQSAGADFQEMVEMDIDYMRHQSFLLDMKILLRTVLRSFSGQGV